MSLTVWHTRSATSVGAFNSYVVPVPTVSGTHPRSLVDVGVRVLSVPLETSHGKLRKSPWLSTVLDEARFWYWSPERMVPPAHPRSEVAVDEDPSYPPSSRTGLASQQLSWQSQAVHLHVVSEANANIGIIANNICQKECTLLLLRRNRDGELLLSAITTLARDSAPSSTARHHDPPGPG